MMCPGEKDVARAGGAPGCVRRANPIDPAEALGRFPETNPALETNLVAKVISVGREVKAYRAGAFPDRLGVSRGDWRNRGGFRGAFAIFPTMRSGRFRTKPTGPMLVARASPNQ